MTNNIQELVDNARKKYDIPGLSVSINFPFGTNQNDYVSGSTTIDKLNPLRPNHLFQVGSIAKIFTATLLLQLDTENVLSINDYIEKWIPIPSDWKGITIKHLLNHTSGIYNYTDTLDEIMKGDQNIDLYKQWETEELINLAKSKPKYCHPGESWHYSNTNYAIAASIIEVATKNKIGKEMKSRFFSLLDLKNTFYFPHKMNTQMLNRMARGYSKRNYFPEEPKDITRYNLSWASAAGGIISTAHDLAIWLRSLMSGILLPPKQMTDLMTTVPTKKHDPASKESYGLGIQSGFTSMGEWFGHSGGTFGYTALASWHKSVDIVIAITANHISTNRDIYLIHDELSQQLCN